MPLMQLNSHPEEWASKRKTRIISAAIAVGSLLIASYQPYRGYSDEVRRECLLMYVNGMGFRGIEREIGGRILLPPTLSRVKGVHHTTVISWVKAVGELLPDAYNPNQIPEVGERGCTGNLCPLKKNKIWAAIKGGNNSSLFCFLWMAVDHFRAGILGWVLGNHSGETFASLGKIVATWHCYFIVTDGWSVYPGFIPPGEKNCG